MRPIGFVRPFWPLFSPAVATFAPVPPRIDSRFVASAVVKSCRCQVLVIGVSRQERMSRSMKYGIGSFYSIRSAICQARLLQNFVTFYTFYTFDANVTKSIKATNGTKHQVAVLLLGMASSLVATRGCSHLGKVLGDVQEFVDFSVLIQKVVE